MRRPRGMNWKTVALWALVPVVIAGYVLARIL
jgi:hypothetical protein